jgi:predicted transposase YbfD/YdcC
MTLMTVFERLGDPRTGPAQRHDLREMILIALCAVMCGADSWVDVAEWGEDHEDWLKEYRELKHGTASHDTYSRVFRLRDAEVFEACFREWIAGLAGIVEGVVAIDGKTVRGSRDGTNRARHMISAYATARGLCLAQEGVQGKGKELGGIKDRLETLTLKGCTVTLDALGGQVEVAEKILARGGDSLLPVKDNPPSLAEAWQEFFNEGEARGFGRLSIRRHESVEKGQGRIETRRAMGITDLSWLAIDPATLAETRWNREDRTRTRPRGKGLPRGRLLYRESGYCFRRSLRHGGTRSLGDRK